MGSIKSAKKGVDKKRSRPSSSTEDEQHDAEEGNLYLELFDLIRTLQASDKA